MGCIIEKLTNLFIGSLPKNMSSTAITTNLFPTNPSRRIPQQKSTGDWNRIVRSRCTTYLSNVRHKPYQLSVLNASILIMAVYIGWFHTLHSNLLNTIHIGECVNPYLEFWIWDMVNNSIKPLHKEHSIDVLSEEILSIRYHIVQTSIPIFYNWS